MPLHLKCPSCGKGVLVPDSAINSRAECGTCHAVHAVRDMVQQQSPLADRNPSDEQGMTRSDKVLLAWCCGVPAALFAVLLLYWFGIRDTWERDNYLRIVQQCDVVDRTIAQSDDAAAADAYAQLNALIGNRTVKHRTLATRLDEVRTAFAPVDARLEKAQREQEAQQLAERRRAEALAEAERGDEQTDVSAWHADQLARLHAQFEEDAKRRERSGRVGNIIAFVFVVLGILAAIMLLLEKDRVSKMSDSARAAYTARQRTGQKWGNVKSSMVCPHCQHRGSIRTKSVTRKKGISGGKATAAVLTGGWSMLATGLSRKERLTQAHCANCNNTWDF